MHLAHVSSSSRNSLGSSSMDSITFAAMLVEPEEELVLKKEGSILAAAGRLSMKGEMSTPERQEEYGERNCSISTHPS